MSAIRIKFGVLEDGEFETCVVIVGAAVELDAASMSVVVTETEPSVIQDGAAQSTLQAEVITTGKAAGTIKHRYPLPLGLLE